MRAKTFFLHVIKDGALIISTILVIYVFFAFMTYLKTDAKKFDLSEYSKDDSIIFEITSTEIIGNEVVIQGYAYDRDTYKEFDNYVSGSFYNYLIHNQLLLVLEDDVYAIYTSPININGLKDMNGENVSFSGFYAKFNLDQLKGLNTAYLGVAMSGNSAKFKINSTGVNIYD